MHTVTAADFVDKMNRKEDMVILDVRTDVEWNAEHLNGTIVHMPLHTLNEKSVERLQSIAKSKPVYILCRSGGRARQAFQFFASHGMTNLHIIEGGIDGCKSCDAKTECRDVISLERQVRILAGTLIVAGISAGLMLTPLAFALSAFVGAGLIFSGITGKCGIALILARAPWNRDPGAEARRSMASFNPAHHS
jgi:rhodanese-related sulfurtransferase